jgi:hypothetical protein
MKTLVTRSTRTIHGKRYSHGSEIPPGALPPEAIDWWLDQHWADECERRSLYRLFPAFSGCTEFETLSSEELKSYALEE